MDDATVYVDAEAEPGGDGLEGAPFRAIQEGVDRLDELGGLVTIGAGTYREHVGPWDGAIGALNDVDLTGGLTPQAARSP